MEEKNLQKPQTQTEGQNVEQPGVPANKSFLDNLKGQLKPLVIIFVVILVILVGTSTFFVLNQNSRSQPMKFDNAVVPTSVINHTTPTPVSTSDWQTLENNDFSILYPAGWNNIPTNPRIENAVFTSPDYSTSLDGQIQTGVIVKLLVYQGRSSSDDPIRASGATMTPIKWLGADAYLVENQKGASQMFIKIKNNDIFITMSGPINENPTDKTLNENKQNFITIANSLKIKLCEEDPDDWHCNFN